MNEISLVIPTIPPRAHLLDRALRSVYEQRLMPYEVIIEEDTHKEGAAVVRDRGLHKVSTDLVAFLDDDDELTPHHFELLLATLTGTRADMVFPWFTVIGGTDPFPQHFGKPWDDSDPRQTTITFLARTEVVRATGGFVKSLAGIGETDADGNRAGEDFSLVVSMSNNGAKIVHLPVRTWLWHHDSRNTSGLPSRW